MSITEFHEAIEAKVRGTWNLHNVSVQRRCELDFFTMLSNISGVVGQKGQANYAAANVFLDNFALYHWQRRLGHIASIAANKPLPSLPMGCRPWSRHCPAACLVSGLNYPREPLRFAPRTLV